MAILSDLPLKERLFLRGYRFRKLDPVPWANPRKPLSETRLALITTGGVFLPEQEPFDKEFRGGDVTFREIPADADISRLSIGQRSEAFDHSGFERDRNLGFPLDRLREMAKRGEIGSIAPRAFSFMGSITAPGRLIAQTAPDVADRLIQDGADALLLIPL